MGTKATLQKLAKRASKAKVLRTGRIAFTLTGRDAGTYFLDCTGTQVQLVQGTPPSPPIIELVGDARQIGGILNGTKDARKHFLAGGYRVRGDLHYLNALALELGLLRESL